MANITIILKTTVTKEQFMQALTDFSAKRSSVWPNSQPRYLTVHSRGNTWADVTEGSDIFGGVWERLRYDWSQPDSIRLETTDSTMWQPGSSWLYRFNPGTVSCTVERFPRGKKARWVIIVVGLAGRIILKRQLRRTLRLIETSYAAGK